LSCKSCGVSVDNLISPSCSLRPTLNSTLGFDVITYFCNLSELLFPCSFLDSFVGFYNTILTFRRSVSAINPLNLFSEQTGLTDLLQNYYHRRSIVRLTSSYPREDSHENI